MEPAYTTNTQCRMCKGSRLTEYLDVGPQPLANAFLKKEDLPKPEPMYPLRVFFCEDCGLSQLVDIVNPEILFRDYVYFSTPMPQLSEHFSAYAKQVVDDFLPKENPFVVEIGSNDGVLLHAMKKFGARILGVDPAVNVARVANERGIETLPEFFSEELALRIRNERGSAHAIIGNNVVAHINDHHDLIKGVKALLADDGVFVFEAPYLVDMFENLTFDTIYHEHMSYLSARPISSFLNSFGMEIIDVKVFPVQGNSLRVYACKKGMRPVRPAVGELVARELAMGMDDIDAYRELARKIASLKQDVVSTVADLKAQGKIIAGYGAPAKGNTLLNYFHIGPETLEYATERLPSKIGLFTPGMHIPVVSIDDVGANPPDYYFMLAWNYKNDILAREKEFIARGGKFIMPVGKVRII